MVSAPLKTTIVPAEVDAVNPPANHADTEGKWSSLHGYDIVAEPFHFSKEVKTYVCSRVTTRELAARMTELTVRLLLKFMLF